MNRQGYKSRKRFEVKNHVRFLTFSCYHRLPLFNNDAIKTAFLEHLVQSKKRQQFDLYAWVVMPEHVHLLLRPDLPSHPVPDILQDIKGGFSNLVCGRWRKKNAPILNRIRDPRGKIHFWQVGGGYDRNIITDDELREKFDYIHQNPVRRQLVDNPLNWRWSSYPVVMGKGITGFPDAEPLPI